MELKTEIAGYSITLQSDILAADLSILLMFIFGFGWVVKNRKWAWLWDWIRTTDHRRIGILYLAAGFAFFLRAGLDALLMRLQLAVPENEFWVFHGDKYNQMMSTHGTTMIFFVAMPLLIGLMNVAVPLQIGARDLAFPYLNALSFWLFAAGGFLINTSFVLGGSPTAGWTGYAPLALDEFTRGTGTDYYVLGLQISGIGTLLTAVNFLVTILRKRAPGMGLLRMPLFTWSTLVTSILILFAFPALTVALTVLMFDRFFGTAILDGSAGNPLIWQHLFWVFGHPEVYILVLPAFGIFSEVIATFSRRRLFGYSSMVFALVLIGFLGFMVWVHHMFTVGLGPVSNVAFAITSMVIAVPTGVKVFNWLFTLRGGAIRFTTPMLFALGFIPSFVVGGTTGVMLAVAPADYQFHDSYFVVGHLHYVLVGGTLLGIFAGLYYWWPKAFGFRLGERLGRWHFWTFLAGFHLTFFPMHFMGLMGMPRRVFTYMKEDGLGPWNLVSTAGAFLMAGSVLLFLADVWWSARKGERAEADPWDGRTLEWALPSPPPEYNFARIPRIDGIDPFWRAKEEGRSLLGGRAPGAIRLPADSAQPFFLSGAFVLAVFGMILHFPWLWIAALCGVGGLLLLRSFTDRGGHVIRPPAQKTAASEGGD